MPKFKITVLRRGHLFEVDNKTVIGIYNQPTVNGKYMYLTEYWGNKDKIYEIKEMQGAEIEILDHSSNVLENHGAKYGSF